MQFLDNFRLFKKKNQSFSFVVSERGIEMTSPEKVNERDRGVIIEAVLGAASDLFRTSLQIEITAKKDGSGDVSFKISDDVDATDVGALSLHMVAALSYPGLKNWSFDCRLENSSSSSPQIPKQQVVKTLEYNEIKEAAYSYYNESMSHNGCLDPQSENYKGTLPQLLREVSSHAFVENIENEHTIIIRQALINSKLVDNICGVNLLN